MTKLPDAIPENMTIAEASEFWDTHSVADYPSHIVTFDYKPDDQITIMAIAGELTDETLVNL